MGSPALALSFEDLTALLQGSQPVPEGGVVAYSGRMTLKQVGAAFASPFSKRVCTRFQKPGLGRAEGARGEAPAGRCQGAALPS